MQNLRKISAFLLCMILVLQISIPALADNDDDNNTNISNQSITDDKDGGNTNQDTSDGNKRDTDYVPDVIITDDDNRDPEPVIVTKKEDTPQARLELSDMTLSNIPANAKYSVDDGLVWITSSGGTVSLTPYANQLEPGKTILLYQPGVENKSKDSDTQTISIGKSSRPGGFQVTDITTPGGTGTISGLSGEMEFSYNNGTSWDRVSGSSVTNLEAGDYYIRIRSMGTNFASEPAIVTVSINIPTPKEKEPTPSASFDARTLTLYDIPYKGSYSTNKGSNWISASGSAEIRNALPGDEILVKVFGDGTNTLDSDTQTIRLSQQSPPSGVTPIPATASTGLGGLDHVNSTMEYCVQGTNNWRSITGNTVNGLYPDNYEIRTLASGSKFASGSIQVTVPIATKKVKQPTPNGRFDAPSMALTGVSVGMAYSFDGGHSFTTIKDNHCTRVSLSNDQASSAIAHNGIQLKMLGNDVTTVDSDIQNISINKANPPKNLSTRSTSDNGGKIYNVNSQMEYARENHGWNNISGDTVNNLKYGTYYVRYKASGSTLASDTVTVEISHKTSKVKEAAPNADFNARIMTLSNIRGVKYSLDGGNNWNYYTDRDKVVLSESSLQLSKGIKLYRPGTNNSTDSDVQLIKLSKAAAPTTLSVTNATSSSLGIIRGVNDYMEYTVMNGSSWTEIYGNTLTNLQPGTYLIRVHGKYNVLPSDPVGVVVGLDNNASSQGNKPPSNNQTGKTPTQNVQTGNQQTGKTQTQNSKDTVPSSDVPLPDSADSSMPQDAASHKAEESLDLAISTDAPVLVSDSGIEGWDAIQQSIVPGKPILISLHNNTSIPASLLMAAKENNSDVIIGMDNHVQWSITASSIEDTTADIDLSVADTAVAIPDSLVNTAGKLGNVVREFTVAHDGLFGFSAYLTLPVKSGTTNQYANLIYYNPNSENLELVSSCNIDDSGYACFEMRHASSYLVIISSSPITSLETKEQNSDRSTTVTAAVSSEKTNVFLIICAVIMITIILINIVLFIIGRTTHRKRRRHRK